MPGPACQPVALVLAADVRHRNVLPSRNRRRRLPADVWWGLIVCCGAPHDLPA